MTEDAHSRFIDGQIVVAQHLQHLQDRLHEGIVDIRSCIGLGKIAWGLRAELNGTQVMVQPGAAFSSSGIRLFLDQATQVDLPADGAPWQVVLRAKNGDVQALRHESAPTIITLSPRLDIESVSDVDEHSMIIATIDNSGASPELSQDQSIFSATGHHGHTGQWRQNSLGQWLYDGPELDISGMQGEKGPKGAKGAKGDKGDVGPEGPAGPAGVAGESGALGEPGPAGPAGADGESGAQGELGPAGPAGEQGPQGDPGPAGTAGADGESGTLGGPGPAGPAGARGPAGNRGPAGPAGPKGNTGLKGAKGAQGARGPMGPAGKQGLGLDLDWPAIARISWNHGGVLTGAQAVEILKRLVVRLTHPISAKTQTEQPQVVQVMYEMETAQQRPMVGVVSLVGGTKMEGPNVFWTARRITGGPLLTNANNSNSLISLFNISSGRVSIRVHCGAMTDSEKRPYSASTDVLHGTTTPRTPGGVFESWFFVGRG